MRSAGRLALLGVLVLAAGCYDSHARFGAGPGLPGPADGGVAPPPFPDGGGPGFGDSGAGLVDSGPGLVDGGVPATDAGGMDGAPPPPPPPVDSGPPADAGRLSRALRFDRGDLVVVAPAPTLDLTRAYTLEMWIRPLSGSGSIAVKGNRETGRYHFGMAMQGAFLVVGWGTATTQHELRVPIERGVWSHVAMIVAAVDPMVARMRVMVNGSVLAEGTFPNDLVEALNDSPFTLGGSPYVGDMDEVRLWEIARRPEGVRTTMHTRVPGGLPGLEAYWRLEESGQLAFDWTAHGHEGVLGRLTTPDADDPDWIDDGPI